MMAITPMRQRDTTHTSSSTETKLAPTVMGASHVTVLLEEAVDGLRLRDGGVYIDGTFGGGGHSRRILEDPARVASVIAIDADGAAQLRAEALQQLPWVGERFRFVHANFRDLARIAEDLELSSVDGILLDLGLSSFQLDDGERGFSFRHDAALDMRFDQSRGQSASDLLNSLPQEDLARLIWEYGEEPQSRRIATGLVRARENAPLTTTGQVAAIIESVVGGRRGRGIHPATRTFQALRIAVNDELHALRDVLAAAIDLLAPGGRLVAIAFHSLEDRIVKRVIEAESARCICPPEQPICTCDHVPRLRRVGKPIRPSEAEVVANPRSRSAIMRVAERLDRAGQPVSVELHS
jgi:16S rRNA (cytosine1402-N4)-methyltransferase